MKIFMIIIGLLIIGGSVYASAVVSYPEVIIFWMTSFIGGCLAGAGSAELFLDGL